MEDHRITSLAVNIANTYLAAKRFHDSTGEMPVCIARREGDYSVFMVLNVDSLGYHVSELVTYWNDSDGWSRRFESMDHWIKEIHGEISGERQREIRWIEDNAWVEDGLKCLSDSWKHATKEMVREGEEPNDKFFLMKVKKAFIDCLPYTWLIAKTSALAHNDKRFSIISKIPSMTRRSLFARTLGPLGLEAETNLECWPYALLNTRIA